MAIELIVDRVRKIIVVTESFKTKTRGKLSWSRWLLNRLNSGCVWILAGIEKLCKAGKIDCNI